MDSQLPTEREGTNTQNEMLEVRIKSFLDQLQVECGILDRMVYKNKNQHRRCSYFQYLLKVRRDLRLLQSSRLEEILSSSFLVINGKRAKQKVQLLESLKRRKCGGKHNFLDCLLGAARLLSQMVEPMLKAATEISILLARSFFMGFSVTIMALLARLRVLVQQILLDVVAVFNLVSSLSRKEQSVKLTHNGIEVFRDLYPSNKQTVYLECIWEADKFVLLEKINAPDKKYQDMDVGENVPLGTYAVQYQSIETLLGEDELGKEEPSFISEQDPATIKENTNTSPLDDPANKNNGNKQVEDDINVEVRSGFAGTRSQNVAPGGGIITHSSLCSSPLKRNSGLRNKVAFVSVKKPTPSTAGDNMELPVKDIASNNGDKDVFFDLLTVGNRKDSLF